jgi:hypothetical protein
MPSESNKNKKHRFKVIPRIILSVTEVMLQKNDHFLKPNICCGFSILTESQRVSLQRRRYNNGKTLSPHRELNTTIHIFSCPNISGYVSKIVVMCVM